LPGSKHEVGSLLFVLIVSRKLATLSICGSFFCLFFHSCFAVVAFELSSARHEEREIYGFVESVGVVVFVVMGGALQ